MTEKGEAERSDPQRAPSQILKIELPDRWPLGLAAGTVIVLAVLAGGSFIYSRSTGLMTTILISVFLGFAMLPAVDRLSARGWRRGPATGVVMLVGLLIFVVFSAAILNLFIAQVRELVVRLPDYADTSTDWLNDNLGVDLEAEGVDEDADQLDEVLEDNFSDIVGGAVGAASTIVGLLFRMLTILLFLFYILADAPRWRAALFSRMSPNRQVEAERILTITIDKVGSYIYSRSMLALASAVFHFVAFLVMGLPFPFAMALWVGVISQFVPTVGLYVAGVIPVLVALLEDPTLVIWVLVAIIVYQQFENYVFSPRITANTMQLHPAIAFGAALLGGNLMGGVGAVLALPVAATVKALIETYTDRHELVGSDRFESPEQYEDRMAAARNQKKSRPWHRRGPSQDEAPAS